MVIFEHRKSTRREGLGFLLGGGIALLTLEGARLTFFPFNSEDMSFEIGWHVILGLVTLFFGYYAIANIIKNQDFICRIDDEFFECISPVRACGDSFKLALGDIVKAENYINQDSRRWYIWDRSGQRYWLTDNYGNPVEAFILAIRKRNRGVVEVETGPFAQPAGSNG